jgi:hypothetical protein
MKKIFLLLLISGLVAAGCTRANPKCKREHKAAKKKGTTGWKY